MNHGWRHTCAPEISRCPERNAILRSGAGHHPGNDGKPIPTKKKTREARASLAIQKHQSGKESGVVTAACLCMTPDARRRSRIALIDVRSATQPGDLGRSAAFGVISRAPRPAQRIRARSTRPVGDLADPHRRAEFRRASRAMGRCGAQTLSRSQVRR